MAGGRRGREEGAPPERVVLILAERGVPAHIASMEFGKIPDIESVDWTIPADDPLSVDFLSRVQAGGAPRGSGEPAGEERRLFFGAPAWGHKEWVGSIYPEKTKATHFLEQYSRYFNCVELNTTHYRIPTPEQAQKWRDQTADGFLFCPKVFQEISHTKQGLRDKVLLKVWLEFLTQLGDRRGPSFIQFPPHFDYSSKAALFEFLKNWPDEFELALEFRHPSWFEQGRILPALTQYLQSRRIGLVITDVAGRRDVLHTSISSDFCMLRFIGNSLHPTDYTRAEKWNERLQSWNEQGLKRMFLFIHEPEDLLTPEMTAHFLKEISTKSSWLINRDLKPPTVKSQLEIIL